MTIQPKFRLPLIQPIVTVGDYWKRTRENPGIPKQALKRPPAVYSNQSHEDVLNFYFDQLSGDEQKEYLKQMTW